MPFMWLLLLLGGMVSRWRGTPTPSLCTRMKVILYPIFPLKLFCIPHPFSHEKIKSVLCLVHVNGMKWFFQFFYLVFKPQVEIALNWKGLSTIKSMKRFFQKKWQLFLKILKYYTFNIFYILNSIKKYDLN